MRFLVQLKLHRFLDKGDHKYTTDVGLFEPFHNIYVNFDILHTLKIYVLVHTNVLVLVSVIILV